MGRHRTPEEKAAFKVQATEMRLAGIGAKRIAKQLGVDPRLVHELLRDVPVPSSLQRSRAKDDHREAAIQLRAEGRTYQEIQRELGVSKGSLSLWLRDLPFPTEEQRDALAQQLPDEADDRLPSDHRGVARLLRTEGWLLREIAEHFDVTVKTASVWCAGLPSPPRATHGHAPEELARMRDAYWQVERQRRLLVREEQLQQARAKVPYVTSELLGLLAAVAYWCEGTKSKPWARKERLTLINQDPDVIRLWLAWLRSVAVAPERLTYRVSIHESADVVAAEAFWGDVVGVDPRDFAKVTLKRHNPKTVRHNTGATYHGCLVVDVRMSRDLYRAVEGTWRGIVASVIDGGRGAFPSPIV